MTIMNQPLTQGFLYTDQYQLTMAQLYFQQGLHERPVQFDLFFREYPDYGEHQAGYCISAGLEPLLQWMEVTRFSDDDAKCLKNDVGPAGNRTFDDDFIDWLSEKGRFDCVSMHAIPEGRVVHPHTPVVSIRGPLGVSQILETALMNHTSYPILVATKACRMNLAGQKRPLLEFGMRRAQGWAANGGARAALIGGADFSSNVGASHALGFPPKGTHAHSMVQVFLGLGMEEIDAFRAYAEVYPDNCILLVDTVDSLGSGVPNAIKVFKELRQNGHEPRGIRLDSGDLAYLAIESAKMLNDAGFEDAAIVLSGDLEEMALWQIIQQIRDDAGAAGLDSERLIQRLMYGVGTNMITSRGAPALKSAYKLVAVCDHEKWQPTVKISETPAKTPTPGTKELWRLYDRRGKATADVIAMPEEDLREFDRIELHHVIDPHKSRTLSRQDISRAERILEPVLEAGKRIAEPTNIQAMRERRDADLERLDTGVKRVVNPHIYHVSLTDRVWRMKNRLVEQMKA
ncbi:MAG: nicotinate phosphoribosyltransferase [bacterium]